MTLAGLKIFKKKGKGIAESTTEPKAQASMFAIFGGIFSLFFVFLVYFSKACSRPSPTSPVQWNEDSAFSRGREIFSIPWQLFFFNCSKILLYSLSIERTSPTTLGYSKLGLFLAFSSFLRHPPPPSFLSQFQLHFRMEEISVGAYTDLALLLPHVREERGGKKRRT